jgi:hypothetical protein
MRFPFKYIDVVFMDGRGPFRCPERKFGFFSPIYKPTQYSRTLGNPFGKLNTQERGDRRRRKLNINSEHYVLPLCTLLRPIPMYIKTCHSKRQVSNFNIY